MEEAQPTPVAEVAPVVELEAPAERGSRRRRGRGGRDRNRRDEESGAVEAEPVGAVGEAEPVRRPSLEELLPLSEAPIEGELPPIPEEFLPMEGAGSDSAEPASAARRGGRRRRFRGGRPDGSGEASGPESSEGV